MPSSDMSSSLGDAGAHGTIRTSGDRRKPPAGLLRSLKVMPGLVPGTHALLACRAQERSGWPGHPRDEVPGGGHDSGEGLPRKVRVERVAQDNESPNRQ